MDAETEALLAVVREARARYGDVDQAPAADAEIADMIARARAELGAEPPSAYADFLRRMNGLNDNGLFVYGTRTLPIAGDADSTIQGLVEANRDWREGGGLDRALVLGEGNQDLYVLDLDSGEYQVRDRVPGDVIERHASFDALLAAALSAHA